MSKEIAFQKVCKILENMSAQDENIILKYIIQKERRDFEYVISLLLTKPTNRVLEILKKERDENEKLGAVNEFN